MPPSSCFYRYLFYPPTALTITLSTLDFGRVSAIGNRCVCPTSVVSSWLMATAVFGTRQDQSPSTQDMSFEYRSAMQLTAAFLCMIVDSRWTLRCISFKCRSTMQLTVRFLPHDCRPWPDAALYLVQMSLCNAAYRQLFSLMFAGRGRTLRYMGGACMWTSPAASAQKILSPAALAQATL